MTSGPSWQAKSSYLCTPWSQIQPVKLYLIDLDLSVFSLSLLVNQAYMYVLNLAMNDLEVNSKTCVRPWYSYTKLCYQTDAQYNKNTGRVYFK